MQTKSVLTALSLTILCSTTAFGMMPRLLAAFAAGTTVGATTFVGYEKLMTRKKIKEEEESVERFRKRLTPEQIAKIEKRVPQDALNRLYMRTSFQGDLKAYQDAIRKEEIRIQWQKRKARTENN